MSLNNDYFIYSEARQHHAELIAEADANRLGRQARRASKKLRRRNLGAQQPAPVDPTVPTAEPAGRPTEAAETRPAAEPTEADREPVSSGRVNSN
jgi:hypothetical protein